MTAQTIRFGKSLVWELVGLKAPNTVVAGYFADAGYQPMQMTTTKAGVGIMFVVPLDPETEKVDPQALGKFAKNLVDEFDIGLRPLTRK